jgi:hypothetical protein
VDVGGDLRRLLQLRIDWQKVAREVIERHLKVRKTKTNSVTVFVISPIF